MCGEFSNRPAEPWVSVVRCDITGRLQNKLPRCVTGVWNDQSGSATNKFTVQNHIQVDRPGIPTPFSLTPQFLLNLLKHFEYFSSSTIGLECSHRIEKRFLARGSTNRWRLKESACRQRFYEVNLRNDSRSFSDQAVATAEITAKADETLGLRGQFGRQSEFGRGAEVGVRDASVRSG